MPAVRVHQLRLGELWVLSATVAVTPLVYSRWTFDVFNITELTTVWIGVTVAFAVRLAAASAGDRFRLPPIWPAMAAYLGVVGVTTLTSRAPMVSFLGNYGRLGGLTTTVPVMVIAWLLWERLDGRPRRHRLVLAGLGLSSAVGALYMIGQELDLEAIGWLQPDGVEPNHPPGLLGNSNFSGAHAALGTGAALWLATQTAGQRRRGWIVVVALTLAGAAVSQSRGAMVAVAITFVVAIVTLRPPRRQVIGATAAAVVLVGAVAIVTVDDGVSDLWDPTTSEERIELWKVALRGAPDHLLLGGGPDLYQLTFDEHAGADVAGIFADEPHNVMLDHLDGSGIPGVVSWLAVVGATIMTGRRADRRGPGGAWMMIGAAYLGQAMVSIDAVPLVLWGWVAALGLVASPGAGGTATDGVPEDASAYRRVPLIVLLGAAASAVALIAVAIGPFRADMAYRRGVQASNRGEHIVAEAQFSQAIERHGWEPRYHTRLGIEYARVLDLTDPVQAAIARDRLLEALDLFPGDPTARGWLEAVEARSSVAGG